MSSTSRLRGLGSGFPLFRRALLIVTATLHFGTATLPADDGGVTTYAAGDKFAGGSVICTRFVQASAAGNYTLPIGPEVVGAAMIVFALQPSDLFTKNMANGNASLDAFLNSDAVGASAVGATSFLFTAYGATDAISASMTAAFRARLVARLVMMNRSTTDTLVRMHFAAQRAGSIAGLSPILEQWTTPITSIQVQLGSGRTMNISRLDGKYEVCSWSSEDAPLPPLVDGGNGCQPLDMKQFDGKTVVVRSEGCSPETAASNGGNIIVAAMGSVPTEISHGCQQGAFATVVSSDEGTALLAVLGSSPRSEVNASLFSKRMPGAFAAIDSMGALQEVGWEKYSTLEMLAWSAQYFDYLTALRANISKPHYSIPITGWQGGRANLTLPPTSVLRSFSASAARFEYTASPSGQPAPQVHAFLLTAF